MNITVNLNQYKYPTHAIWALMGMNHKVLTYVEYRAVSGVFQNIDPPPPSPLSECDLLPHQRRGVHTRRGVRGVGGQYFEDASHRIGLLQSISLRHELIRCKLRSTYQTCEHWDDILDMWAVEDILDM